MGAPGHYILCPKGHEIGVIEDDLYWDDDMFKKLEKLEQKKCPICGQKAKYNFCHYGDINDCTDIKLVWNSTKKRWIIPSQLTEEQKKELADHIIKKDRIIKTIKTEKVTETEREDIIGIIEGTEISQIRCRKSSQFGQNILDAKVGDEIYIYAIDAPAVLRMANEFRFNVIQRNKRKYLVPVEKFENGVYVNMEK